jgi:hypothetical protein
MCPARIDQKRPVRLIDDLDDLARPWLNDHAAVIDDRVPVEVKLGDSADMRLLQLATPG